MRKILVFNLFPDAIGGTYRIFDQGAPIPGDDEDLEIVIYEELDMLVEFGTDIFIATPKHNTGDWEKRCRTAISRAFLEEAATSYEEWKDWKDFFSQ